jgi:hypothetical protein
MREFDTYIEVKLRNLTASIECGKSPFEAKLRSEQNVVHNGPTNWRMTTPILSDWLSSLFPTCTTIRLPHTILSQRRLLHVLLLSALNLDYP